MKKIFLFIILLIIVSSCTMPIYESWLDFEVPQDIIDENFKSVEEIDKWVWGDHEFYELGKEMVIVDHIVYRKSLSSYFKSPKNTLLNKSGNCVAHSILISALCYKLLDKKISLVICSSENDFYNHMGIIHKNKLYSKGIRTCYKIERIINFEDIQSEIDFYNGLF